MILVIDANSLVQMIPSISKHHWLWTYFLEGKYHWAFTTDILLEYEEVFSRWSPINVVHNVIRTIADHPKGVEIEPFYFWKMVDKDKDDNKYIDCAIAASADCLVSNDRHFKVLHNAEFPGIRWLKIDEVKPSMFD